MPSPWLAPRGGRCEPPPLSFWVFFSKGLFASLAPPKDSLTFASLWVGGVTRVFVQLFLWASLLLVGPMAAKVASCFALFGRRTGWWV